MACECRSGVGLRLGPAGGENSGEAQCGHRGVDGPAMRGGARHAAEGDREGRRDEKDGEHLQEVREGRGVLKRMRAVGVEEATAVGASILMASCEATAPCAMFWVVTVWVLVLLSVPVVITDCDWTSLAAS